MDKDDGGKKRRIKCGRISPMERRLKSNAGKKRVLSIYILYLDIKIPLADLED